MADKDLNISLTAEDKMSGVFEKLEKVLSRVDKSLSKVDSITKKAGSTFLSLGKATLQAKFLISAFGGTLLGLGKTLSSSANPMLAKFGLGLSNVSTGAMLANKKMDGFIKGGLKKFYIMSKPMLKVVGKMALTFGAWAVAIIGVTKALKFALTSLPKYVNLLDDMDKKASDLNMTFDEFSKLRYGRVLDREVLKPFNKLKLLLRDVGKQLENVKVKMLELTSKNILGAGKTAGGLAGGKGILGAIGNIIPGMNIMGTATKTMSSAMKDPNLGKKGGRTESEIASYKQITDEIDSLTKNSYQRREEAQKKHILHLQKQAQRQPVNAKETADLISKIHKDADWEKAQRIEEYEIMVLDAEGKTVQAALKASNMRIAIAKKELDKVGALYVEKIEKAMQESTKLAQYGLKNTFQAMEEFGQGAFQSLNGLFQNLFVDGLNNKFQNARQIAHSFFMDLQQMAVRALANEVFSKLLGSFGQAGGSSGGGGIFKTIGNFFRGSSNATGGIIPKSGMAMVHQGEKVVPAREASGGEKQVTYIINAVDASSFNQLVQRNPEAIEIVINRALRNNTSVRETMKKTLR